MENYIKKSLIEALKAEQSIFGDLLFLKKEEPAKVKLNFAAKENPKVEVKIEVAASNEEFNQAKSISELNDKICNCKKCSLAETRTKFVFGVGNPETDAMLVGEAPGADEDLQGEPFVGKAGQLLNDILAAIKFKREEVYIANILKCRPPGNRNPETSEINLCIPYLYKQIELIKPKVILCLGRYAAIGLLKNNLSLTKMRGNIYELNGIKVIVTYHPAALLRNPGWKRECWEDVQLFRKIYDEIAGK